MIDIRVDRPRVATKTKLLAFEVRWNEEIGAQVFVAASWQKLGEMIDEERRIGGAASVKCLGPVSIDMRPVTPLQLQEV